MNKKILFAAVGAALAVAPMISAQADVKVGGSAHLSLDKLDNGAATNVGEWYVSSNSSNIFISASEDLGGGMKAIAYFEHLYTQDVTTSGQANRNNYVGLSGGFGTVKLGFMDDPTKQAGRAVDLFYNEQLGESRAIVRQIRWDERTANSIRYDSNDMSGFSFAVLYGVEDSFTTDAVTLDLGVTYKAGPLYVGVSRKSVDDAATTASSTATRIGATYDMGAFKFAGLYQQVSDEGFVSGRDRTTMGLGVAFKAGNNTFKAQWYQADAADGMATANGGDQTSIGIDHNLSKNTVVYAAYAKTSNDASGAFGVGSHGHGASAIPAVGVDSSGLSFGMRMKF